MSYEIISTRHSVRNLISSQLHIVATAAMSVQTDVNTLKVHCVVLGMKF